jgi:uncharacterized membrane protein
MLNVTEDGAQPLDEPLARAAGRETILYALAALLSLFGIADAIYLTVEHLSGRSAQCLVTTGCSKVLSSAYATPFGIPLSIVGAVAYFTVFSLAILAAFGYGFAGRVLTFIVACMFLTTLVLLYLQAFVIGEYCDYCLLSAIITATLTLITGALLYLRSGKRQA